MKLLPFDIVIDVSDNQQGIDWSAVYAFGIRIAFVKAMEGAGLHYPSWGPQSEGARKAGIVVIPYLFLRPGDPKLVIQHFLATTALAKGEAFMLDFEGRASQTMTPTGTEAVGDGLSAVAKRLPIGYWGILGSTPAAPTAKMLTWERMVPRYPVPATSWAMLPPGPRTAPTKWWIPDGKSGTLPRFAQYTASGKVTGISTSVDRSVVFAESAEAAIAWCKAA